MQLPPPAPSTSTHQAHHHQRPSSDSHAGQLRKNGWVLGRQLEAWWAGSYARPVCCSRSCESGNYQPTFVHRLKLIESVLLPSSAHRMISRASDRRASSSLPFHRRCSLSPPDRTDRADKTSLPSLAGRLVIALFTTAPPLILIARRIATVLPAAPPPPVFELPAGCMRR